jgi:hypothetical protein
MDPRAGLHAVGERKVVVSLPGSQFLDRTASSVVPILTELSRLPIAYSTFKKYVYLIEI